MLRGHSAVMYPALLTIVTTALIVAVYAELTGIFSADDESTRLQNLRPIKNPNDQSRHR